MMTLSDYMTHQNKRQDVAAREIGISRSYLSEILTGAKQPGRDTIAKIAIWSGNQVSPEVWFNPHVQQNAQQANVAVDVQP
jgi:transcriptional regulator with XRE-family HTH domain